MRNYLLFLLLTISILAHSQEKDSNNKQKIQIEKTNGPTPWTSLNLNNNPGKFQFAIIPDRTGGHRPGVFMDAVNKLNLLQPEFVMSIGDLIEGYSTNIDQLNRQWDEFDSFVKQLEMPFFYLPGNHDFTNQVMEDLWKKRLGSSYYHFIYKDVLFLMLNSEDQKLGDGKGTISDPQYKFVQQILTKYPDVKWTIVFMHQPLWHQTETRHWKNVEKLLANRKHTVFAGHEHRYVKEDRNNGKYFILATTGGYSPLRGKELGEFDHIVWVSMTENGPIISNLQLDGILNENIVTKPIQDYIDLVSTKSPLQIKPIYKEKEHLKSEIIEVKITNDENVPMHVKFTEDCCYDLVGIPKRNELTIAPNSLEVVKLKVKTEITTHEKPIKIKAYVLYQFENIENKPQIQFSYNIKALKPYRLTKINREIKIDGLFNDWSNLPQNWASEDNKIGVSFDVGYDKEFLYVAAKIKDNKVVSFGEGHTWTQDGIGVIINTENKEKSAMSNGSGWYKNEIFIPITPASNKIKSIIGNDLPQGTQVKCQLVDSGYFFEMALPIAYIKEKQSKNWESIRINLYVDNLDNKDVTRHWWKPDWRGYDNIIGSGMFFK